MHAYADNFSAAPLLDQCIVAAVLLMLFVAGPTFFAVSCWRDFRDHRQ